MKIIFMGTPDFAVPALHSLLNSDHKVIAVYTQPPRPKGRGMQIQKSPVHQIADANNIPVFTPKSLRKSEDEQQKFAALNADIAVVAAYGLLLPKSVLDAPTYGCINIHASLLPRWRGASPIQHAIWKGDSKSGVTIMQMEEGLDTGPMIMSGETVISPTTTASQLHDALSLMGGTLILDTLHMIEKHGNIQSTPQNDDAATYAPILSKSDGHIDLTRPAIDIDRQVRALNPWPGTYITGPKGRIKILKSHVGPDDKIVIDLLQPEGKKPMDVVSAKNGGYL